MKKILILGSAGMAGHTISEYLRSLVKYDVVDVARNAQYYPIQWELDIEKGVHKIDLILGMELPNVIINCIGLLVKQCEQSPERAIFINSYFPHYLEKVTTDTGIRVIHLSTDCIFSGKKGNYSETDIKDGEGWYAQSKALGEMINNKDLTIRMSIIGDELKPDGIGLFDWFIKQKGEVRGFSKCYWNGISTLELAKQIDRILDTNLTGLYQLAPDFKIDKYNLLLAIKRIWNKEDVTILEDDSLVLDKTLVNGRINEYDPQIPEYETQLQELRDFIK